MFLAAGWRYEDNAPENLARLRRFALDLLRADQGEGSTPGKIERAAWDDASLIKILSSARCDRPAVEALALARAGGLR